MKRKTYRTYQTMCLYAGVYPNQFPLSIFFANNETITYMGLTEQLSGGILSFWTRFCRKRMDYIGFRASNDGILSGKIKILCFQQAKKRIKILIEFCIGVLYALNAFHDAADYLKTQQIPHLTQ